METINRLNAYFRNSETMFATEQVVNLQLQKYYVPLPDNVDEIDDTRYIKQRTQRWTHIRNQAKITGSTIYTAFGLDGLKTHKTTL